MDQDPAIISDHMYYPKKCRSVDRKRGVAVDYTDSCFTCEKPLFTPSHIHARAPLEVRLGSVEIQNITTASLDRYNQKLDSLRVAV